jgi:hypothetical protein
MKNSLLYLTLIMIIVFPRYLTSQEINPLDFFPHHVGDLWQYMTYSQISSEFWEKKITAIDTSWVDSSKIITMNYRNSVDITYKIYFKDSLTVYWKTFGDWGICYRFDVPTNTWWLSDPYFLYYTLYFQEYEAFVFDDSLQAREYWTEGDTIFNLSLWTEHLALGIGYFYGEFEVGITVLNGCIVNGIQYGTIISVEKQNDVNPPKEFLLNNYPNPFNPQTKIKFYMPERSFVKLKVYDILGNKIKILVDEELDIGYHEITFDGSGLPSGVYFYTLQTPKFAQTKKMVLLR